MYFIDLLRTVSDFFDNLKGQVFMARSNFSFEKRRKELEKRKKKDAKRQAKADRKAAVDAGEEVIEPVITIDEFGNVVEVYPETDASGEGPDEDDADEEETKPGS